MYSFWLFLVACILHLPSALGAKRTKRIVGGQLVPDFQGPPYMGFLEYKDEKNVTQGCGATILSPKYILTAASCVKTCRCLFYRINVDDKDCKLCYTFNANVYYFYSGSTFFNQNDRVYMSKWYIHPNYKYFDGKKKCFGNNDIAVGELKEPLVFSETINKVQLPEAITLNQVNVSWKPIFGLPEEQTRAEVFGWGDVIGFYYDTSKFEGRKLKSVNLTLVDNDQCMSYLHASSGTPWERDNHTRNFGLCYDTYYCTIDPAFKSAPCFNDYGGPLILNNTQIGIFSQSVGLKCVGYYNPNGYTRVDIYVDWINSIIG